MEDEKTYENEPDPDLKRLIRDVNSARSTYIQSSKEAQNTLLSTFLSDFGKKKELQLVEIEKTFGPIQGTSQSTSQKVIQFANKEEGLKSCISIEKGLLSNYNSLLSRKLLEVQRFILNNHKQDNLEQVRMLENLARNFPFNAGSF